MIYNTLLARSFTKHEQKKLGIGALIACFLVVFSCVNVLKPPNPKLLGGNQNDAIKESSFSLRSSEGALRNEVSCNFTKMAEFCYLEGDVRVNGRGSTIRSVVEGQSVAGSFTWKLRPYGRRFDGFAMNATGEWEIKMESGGAPSCAMRYSVPGILFSVGAYAGNHFHAFTDVLVPLFAAARPYNGEVVFVVTDLHRNPHWIEKFSAVLKGLSLYEPVDAESDEEETVHCFPSMLAGPKHRSVKELSLDGTETPYKITDFMEFLRGTYGLKRSIAGKAEGSGDKKPRLLIISRSKSRVFLNIGEVQAMAEEVGFEVVVKDTGKNMSIVAEDVNSCDVMLGIHGAGLTNLVFLPENAVVVQIVPVGGAEWVSSTFFGKPTEGMKVRYVEYRIELEESSLKDQYRPDDIVLTNPQAIKDKGWDTYRSVYFDKQNVNINITRFRPTLMKAMELLRT